MSPPPGPERRRIRRSGRPWPGTGSRLWRAGIGVGHPAVAARLRLCPDDNLVAGFFWLLISAPGWKSGSEQLGSAGVFKPEHNARRLGARAMALFTIAKHCQHDGAISVETRHYRVRASNSPNRLCTWLRWHMMLPPMSTIPGTPNATCAFHRSHVHKRLAQYPSRRGPL